MASAKLTKLLQPLIEDLGYEFVGIEHHSNPKNPVVTIYIDSPEGIAIEDCAAVSREVAALLDVEDPIPGHYDLEVSSPGLDRPLFGWEQFARFVGDEAAVTMFAPVDGQRKFKGRILGASEGRVTLEQDGVEVMLEMANVAKARLVPDYEAILAEKRNKTD